MYFTLILLILINLIFIWFFLLWYDALYPDCNQIIFYWNYRILGLDKTQSTHLHLLMKCGTFMIGMFFLVFTHSCIFFWIFMLFVWIFAYKLINFHAKNRMNFLVINIWIFALKIAWISCQKYLNFCAKNRLNILSKIFEFSRQNLFEFLCLKYDLHFS